MTTIQDRIDTILSKVQATIEQAAEEISELAKTYIESEDINLDKDTQFVDDVLQKIQNINQPTIKNTLYDSLESLAEERKVKRIKSLQKRPNTIGAEMGDKVKTKCGLEIVVYRIDHPKLVLLTVSNGRCLEDMLELQDINIEGYIKERYDLDIEIVDLFPRK